MNSITTSAVHHVTLTVTDFERSTGFYTGLLGFQLAMMFGPRAILSNGQFVLALTPPPDPAQAISNDQFNENRVGLDHISLAVENRAVLETAAALFDAQGISHGEIKDLGADLAIYVLAFRDPDNIQLELTAPHG